MIYPYACNNCKETFEVVKHHSKSGLQELCPKCGFPGKYIFTVPQINTEVCHEEAQYNPAFGCVVKNKAHRKDLAKRNDMIEIGNEPVDSIHKATAKTRETRMRDYGRVGDLC